MSYFLNKITRGSQADMRRASEPTPLPKCPPSPTLTHLTSEEIQILNDVFRRQDEFEQQEADRIRRLESDLVYVENMVAQQASNKNKLRQVDLRLCRLCFKNKFSDGIGRICHDCHRRVCNKCGSYTRLKWDSRKNRHVKGRWRCFVCQKRREYACVSGEWFHGSKARPMMNSYIFQRMISDMCSGTESDLGHQSAPGGYECMEGTSRTDTEASRYKDFSPRAARRFHRRRTYSGESLRCDDDEDLDLDHEQFWQERQKCRRERLERVAKKKGLQPSRLSAEEGELFPSPQQWDTFMAGLPPGPVEHGVYPSDEYPPYPGAKYVEPIQASGSGGGKYCKVHGYRTAKDLQTEARLRAAGILPAGVRRSSSDGASLDQSLPTIPTFARTPFDACDTVGLLDENIGPEHLMNPHLSTFRKEELSVSSDDGVSFRERVLMKERMSISGSSNSALNEGYGSPCSTRSRYHDSPQSTHQRQRPCGRSVHSSPCGQVEVTSSGEHIPRSSSLSLGGGPQLPCDVYEALSSSKHDTRRPTYTELRDPAFNDIRSKYSLGVDTSKSPFEMRRRSAEDRLSNIPVSSPPNIRRRSAEERNIVRRSSEQRITNICASTPNVLTRGCEERGGLVGGGGGGRRASMTLTGNPQVPVVRRVSSEERGSCSQKSRRLSMGDGSRPNLPLTSNGRRVSASDSPNGRRMSVSPSNISSSGRRLTDSGSPGSFNGRRTMSGKQISQSAQLSRPGSAGSDERIVNNRPRQSPSRTPTAEMVRRRSAEEQSPNYLVARHDIRRKSAEERQMMPMTDTRVRSKSATDDMSPPRVHESRRKSVSDQNGGFAISHMSKSHDKRDLISSKDNIEQKKPREREDSERMRKVSKGRRLTSTVKVVLKRDAKDGGARRGLGMRVVGGKRGKDDKLGAFVTYVAKGDEADKAGIRADDQILEWNGSSLVDVTFEEARRIMDRTGDTVTLIVQRGNRKESVSDSTQDGKNPPSWHFDSEISSSAMVARGRQQSRRSLPRIPVEHNKKKKTTCGRLSGKLWYDWRTSKLHVTILRVQGLQHRDGPEREMPHAFVKIYLLPDRSASESFRTDIATGTSDPEWKVTFQFENITDEQIARKTLELTLWDFYAYKANTFLGEVLLDLSTANLQDEAVWYPLNPHDENSGSLPPQSPKPRPRSSAPSILEKNGTNTGGSDSSPAATVQEVRNSWASLPVLPATPAHDKAKRILHKRQKSFDADLLHRVDTSDCFTESRGSSSSPSKQRESLSSKIRRRMSTVVSKMGARLADKRSLSVESKNSLLDMERTSSGRRLSRTLAMDAVKDDLHQSDLSDSMTHRSHNSSKTPSIASTQSDSELDESIYLYLPNPVDGEYTSRLGTGQLAPKLNMQNTVHGDVFLGFIVTQGHLEIDVLCARGLSLNNANQPPDTYVKTCLMEGGRAIQRKKTRIVKSETEPVYRQKIKYPAGNIRGRYVRIQVKGKSGGFDRNQCLGEAVIRLDSLDLSRHTKGWYKLFQSAITDVGSAESIGS